SRASPPLLRIFSPPRLSSPQAAAGAAAKKCASFQLGSTPSSGSRRQRCSWTGGFAWRAVSHLRMACDDLLSVSGGLASGAPENVCAQAFIEAWCRVAPSDRRLLSPRCSDGRPRHVL